MRMQGKVVKIDRIKTSLGEWALEGATFEPFPVDHSKIKVGDTVLVERTVKDIDVDSCLPYEISINQWIARESIIAHIPQPEKPEKVIPETVIVDGIEYMRKR